MTDQTREELIAEARDDAAGWYAASKKVTGRQQIAFAGVGRMLADLADALERSAAQTTEAKAKALEDAATSIEFSSQALAPTGNRVVDAEVEKVVIQWLRDRADKTRSVAAVPEPVKPIERPGVTVNKSLAELLKLDEHPQVEADWQEQMRSIAEAEFRAWAARDIHKLGQMDGFVAGVERVVSAVVPEDPKPDEPVCPFCGAGNGALHFTGCMFWGDTVKITVGGVTPKAGA